MCIRINIYVLVSALAVSTIVCSYTLGADVDDKAFSYDDYAAVLKTYVDNMGMVNYKQLKAHREKLDAFAQAISELDTKTYEKWSKEDKVAFWINAYNGLTLKVIIDNYPIKPSFFKSIYYPKNSIRQIPGVWDKKKFKVMGKDMGLEHIEHVILRKQFDEPGIHVALVCAAMGCPPLRDEPYIGNRLEEQLDNQTRSFLANPKKFMIDRKAGQVNLSPIFKWFGHDFTNKYGLAKKLPGLSKNETAVINFLSRHLDKDDRDYLMRGNFRIRYSKYDWSLNEQLNQV
jgi:hypothetical protein